MLQATISEIKRFLVVNLNSYIVYVRKKFIKTQLQILKKFKVLEISSLLFVKVLLMLITHKTKKKLTFLTFIRLMIKKRLFFLQNFLII